MLASAKSNQLRRTNSYDRKSLSATYGVLFLMAQITVAERLTSMAATELARFLDFVLQN
jgi:hypothetical protein